jgi:integrase
MANKRRNWSEGSIVARGSDIWRLRYWHNGKRHSATVTGSKADAREALRKLLHATDTGQHVDYTRVSVAEWVEHWLAAGAPGRKKQRPGRRAVERYGQLLRVHVVPSLGKHRLQKLAGPDIDGLYAELAEKDIEPRTAHHVHTVFNACLGAAVRSGALAANPMLRVLQAPSPGEANHGIALGDDDMRRLLVGFRGSSIELIVTIAARTGMRRNEILALRWIDLDVAAKELKVERAIEKVAGKVAFKLPKTKRGLRAIAIDDSLLELLVAEREKYQRVVAGVTNSAAIDLSLVKLPADALMFPSPAGRDLQSPRDDHAVTTIFKRRAARLGFKQLRFHDLRGSHGVSLLRKGVPIDVVARRLGHDPATLLRSYAKAVDSDDKLVRDALKAMLPVGGNGK